MPNQRCCLICRRPLTAAEQRAPLAKCLVCVTSGAKSCQSCGSFIGKPDLGENEAEDCAHCEHTAQEREAIEATYERLKARYGTSMSLEEVFGSRSGRAHPGVIYALVTLCGAALLLGAAR